MRFKINCSNYSFVGDFVPVKKNQYGISIFLAQRIRARSDMLLLVPCRNVSTFSCSDVCVVLEKQLLCSRNSLSLDLFVFNARLTLPHKSWRLNSFYFMFNLKFFSRKILLDTQDWEWTKIFTPKKPAMRNTWYFVDFNPFFQISWRITFFLKNFKVFFEDIAFTHETSCDLHVHVHILFKITCIFSKTLSLERQKQKFVEKFGPKLIYFLA